MNKKEEKINDSIMYETEEDRNALLRIFCTRFFGTCALESDLTEKQCFNCMEESKKAYRVYKQEINRKNK